MELCTRINTTGKGVECSVCKHQIADGETHFVAVAENADNMGTWIELDDGTLCRDCERARNNLPRLGWPSEPDRTQIGPVQHAQCEHGPVPETDA